MSGLFRKNGALNSLLAGSPSNGLGSLADLLPRPPSNTLIGLALMERGGLAALAAKADPAFHVYEDKAGEYRWKFKAGNHWIMGDGGESYTTKASADRAVDRFRQLVATAPIRYD